MKIAFVSDRYPPDIRGGAEISLRYLVAGIDQREEAQAAVIALSEKVTGTVEETVDGVPVVRVPTRYDHRFPLPDVPWVVPWARERTGRRRTRAQGAQTAEDSAQSAQFRFSWRRIPAAIRAHLRYLFTKTRAPFPAKLALFISNGLCYLLSRENIECLDEDFDQIVNTGELKRALDRIRPDLVHADNFRSILRISELDLRCPTLAMVRDLKFICPRRIRIAHVGDRSCETCDFSCLREIPWIVRPFLRAVFVRNREYRRQSLAAHRCVATTSKFLRDFMEREIGIRAEVVPNAVGDLASIEEAKSRLRRNTEFPTVASAGMLERNKGVDHLIRIMPGVRKAYPNARMQIAGKGGYEPALRKTVEKIGAKDYIYFKGFLSGEDLFQFYLDADLVVCFTRWPEPFGRVPIEAMAFEIPVAASNQGGFPETIDHEQTGLLVKTGNEDELLKAVLTLLGDSERRREMGKKGYEKVLHNYTQDVVAYKIYRLYIQIVNEVQ